MGLENFDPIFTEPKLEWPEDSNVNPIRPFVLHAHAPDPSLLRVQATDFYSNTWEATRSIHQLEDLRDNMGIGGSWSDFIDYVAASIKSEDVKLVFAGPSKSDGAANAKLIAQKSKGMPLISISLIKLLDADARVAMANLSLELYKAFRGMHQLLNHEQERCCQLTKVISVEQGKNESIQRQLDTILYSKRQKSQKMNDKTSDASSVASLQNSPAAAEKTADQGLVSKVTRRAPAYRRSKVRGAILQDIEDDADAI